MSKFEKIIIPLAFDDIKKSDFTDNVGFIDSYTIDDDNPWEIGCIMLVYNDRLRSDDVAEMSRRFSKSKHLRRTYIKLVNNIPYYFYVFNVPWQLKKLLSGVMNLTTEQKVRILQFWGGSDEVVDFVLSNPVIAIGTEHKAPLRDVRHEIDEGLTIKKAIVS